MHEAQARTFDATTSSRHGRLVAVLALVGLTMVACGGGKANPPPATERTGGTFGTGGRIGGTGGSGTMSGTGGDGTGGSGSGIGGMTTPGTDTAPVENDGAIAEVAAPEDMGSAAPDTAVDTAPEDTRPAGPLCGNGMPDPNEACDRGDSMNVDKAYGVMGECNKRCQWVPYCGDTRTKRPEEECDGDKEPTKTAAGCKTCKEVAKLPNCGDRMIEMGEACDNGTTGTNRNIPGDWSPRPATGNNRLCNTMCQVITKFCGNGVPRENPEEECDEGRDGKEPTFTAPGCSTMCKVLPMKTVMCGDKVVTAPEKCDYGTGPGEPKNLTSAVPYQSGRKPTPYEVDPATGRPRLFCNSICQFANFCGDATVQALHEDCDKGMANTADAAAYGPDKCSDKCEVVPFCGDDDVNGPAGREECDNGTDNVATDTAYGTKPAGSAPKPCRRGVCTLVPYCGDGKKNGPAGREQCDGTEGITAPQTCKADCTIETPAVTPKDFNVTGLDHEAPSCTGTGPKAACIAELNERDGVAVQVSCPNTATPPVNAITHIDFGVITGLPAGATLRLTLGGLPGTGASVSCEVAAGGAIGTAIPGVTGGVIPPECYTGAPTKKLRIRIRNTTTACLTMTYAHVTSAM